MEAGVDQGEAGCYASAASNEAKLSFCPDRLLLFYVKRSVPQILDFPSRDTFTETRIPNLQGLEVLGHFASTCNLWTRSVHFDEEVNVSWLADVWDRCVFPTNGLSTNRGNENSVLANGHSKAKPFILPRESVKVTIVIEFSFF